MIYHVNGTLEYCEPGTAVIDCMGVGYECNISDNTYERIVAKTGERVKLLTHLAVREDGVELFGFSDYDELTSFRLLTSVSGIGPKGALSILSLLTPDKLNLAIATEDAKTIAKANGIGPKTAARVVLELRDKVAKAPFTSAVLSSMPEKMDLNASNLKTALEGLLVLGFSRSEAQSALSGLDPSADTERLIAMALGKLSR